MPVGSARCAAALLLLLFIPSARVTAKEIEGVQFADRVAARGTTMALNCVGLLRYMMVIKGYVAALYLAPGTQPATVLSDVGKRLEINYFYAIKGPQFAAATNQGIAANVDAAEVAALRPRIDRLNGLYQDVKPGDRYALTYIPGVGTELAFNGTPKGTIEGADFAAALFAIWLGPKPIDAALKDQLLRCS